MEQYTDQLDNIDEYSVERANVTRIVVLTPEDYDTFCHNLLTDYEWLSGQGGTSTTADLPDVPYFELTGAQQEAFADASYLLVVKVVAEGRDTLYVDPQGHHYARYVAFPCDVPQEATEEDALFALFPALAQTVTIDSSTAGLCFRPTSNNVIPFPRRAHA